MSNIKDLSVAQLKRAIEIREQIESLQDQLASIGGGRLGRPPGIKTVKGKRRMSAAAAPESPLPPKRDGPNSADGGQWTVKGEEKKRFNAAARAQLSAAAKARWAKAKAAGKSNALKSVRTVRHATLLPLSRAPLALPADAFFKFVPCGRHSAQFADDFCDKFDDIVDVFLGVILAG